MAIIILAFKISLKYGSVNENYGIDGHWTKRIVALKGQSNFDTDDIKRLHKKWIAFKLIYVLVYYSIAVGQSKTSNLIFYQSNVIEFDSLLPSHFVWFVTLKAEELPKLLSSFISSDN